jgi:hypothetical protein
MNRRAEAEEIKRGRNPYETSSPLKLNELIIDPGSRDRRARQRSSFLMASAITGVGGLTMHSRCDVGSGMRSRSYEPEKTFGFEAGCQMREYGNSAERGKVETASVTASSLDRGFGHARGWLPDQYRIALADPGGAELQ